MSNKNLIIGAIRTLQEEVKLLYKELEAAQETPEVQNYLFLKEQLRQLYRKIEINQEFLSEY